MNAMVLAQQAPIATGPLNWTDVADPVPGPGQVRVRVACCGTCRTDLHVIEGDLPPVRLPLTPGHQVVGFVDPIGPQCVRPRPGQRVGVAWLGSTCGTCQHCRTSREKLCESAQFTGYTLDGDFATAVSANEDFAYEIPDAFMNIEAAPLLCADIIGYRSLQRANSRPGCRLALYGFGSSAHVVIQIALDRGYEVYVATRGEAHRELARRLGAKWVGEHPSEMPAKVHSAIIFAPAGELVPPALEKPEKGGTLALAGIQMSDIPPLRYEQHLFYEREARSVTCNTREDGRALLAEAASIPIRPRIISYPLREANRALQDLK